MLSILRLCKELLLTGFLKFGFFLINQKRCVLSYGKCDFDQYMRKHVKCICSDGKIFTIMYKGYILSKIFPFLSDMWLVRLIIEFKKSTTQAPPSSTVSASS